MKWSAVLGGTIGMALSAALLYNFGFSRIMALLAGAGWMGIAGLIVLHVIQMWFSALGWRAIAAPTVPRTSRVSFLELRWIRESVNNLLPLAQVGGEVIVARLLSRRGMHLSTAIAGTVADLSMEMLSQIAFTLIGLLMLLHAGAPAGPARYVFSAVLAAAALAAGFAWALRAGIVKRLERWLIKIGRSMGWAAAAAIDGVEERLLECYAAPRRVASSAAWHMGSWLLGAVEVQIALHVLAHPVNLQMGLIIESLGQAMKAAGFAVPGALGIQEGGYVLICRALGIGPEIAIALSLMKRLREIALGLPGMIAWHFSEQRLRPVAAPFSERFP